MRNMISKIAEQVRQVYGGNFKQHDAEAVNFMTFVLDKFKDKRDINIVEIGICFGANLVFMGNVLVNAGKNVKGIGIDLPNQAIWGGHDINPAKEILRGNPLFQHEIILTDSHETYTLELLQKKMDKIDLLFIDGDHSEKGCLLDFHLYKQLVAPGGIIGIHDITEHKPWPHVEVWKVWANLKPLYKCHEFAYREQYGIGAIEI